jgi:collagenase-like PrtC family protease
MEPETMKFAAGFKYFRSGEIFCDILADYLGHIEEVFFSVPGIASGRPDAALDYGEESLSQLVYELKVIRQYGIKLDMLLNGNCYGDDAVSVDFEERIVSMLDWFGGEGLFPDIVTVASPFAAHAIRKHFPAVEIRASVNMRIDSLTALEYLSDKIDSFYLRRDLQRDMENVKIFSDWSFLNGKKMCLLANSGCLRNCPYQTFHDNLVSHDSMVRRKGNAADFIPHLCWERYCKGGNASDFLRSSWIRPEDVKRYEPYCSVMKIATRQHSNLRMVLGAYCSGSFNGNMFDLTEPCFSTVFAPYILDNRKLDGVELPGKCAVNCTHCGKCENILKKALVNIES